MRILADSVSKQKPSHPQRHTAYLVTAVVVVVVVAMLILGTLLTSKPAVDGLGSQTSPVPPHSIHSMLVPHSMLAPRWIAAPQVDAALLADTSPTPDPINCGGGVGTHC
jgi:hypothetical protein